MKVIAMITTVALVVIALTSGAFAAGPGFSGIAANADTAETVVNNPAGMMRLRKPSIYGNPMVLYMKSESEITASGTGKKETISDDSFVALPGLYYARPLGDNWAVGIGPHAATGLGVTYDDDWAGRYLLKEWSLTFVGIAPSVAYRFDDKFSIGVSVPIMYSQYTLEKAVFNLDPAADDGSFELEADGWGVGVNVGMLYELTAHTRFGLVYRSKVSVTEEGEPEYSDLTVERKQLLNKFGALNEDISVDTSTPQAVIAGVFHEFQNGWSFSFDAAWIDFSEWGLEDVEIGDAEVSTRPTNYKDMWAATLGVNYEITPKWTTRSGVFYVSSALDEEDRTAFTRFDQMWGAGLGLEYKLRNDRTVSFDVTYLQFGDGRFEVKDVPRAGDIEGEYTTNYALVFGVGTTW